MRSRASAKRNGQTSTPSYLKWQKENMPLNLPSSLLYWPFFFSPSHFPLTGLKGRTSDHALTNKIPPISNQGSVLHHKMTWLFPRQDQVLWSDINVWRILFPTFSVALILFLKKEDKKKPRRSRLRISAWIFRCLFH